MPTSTDGQGGLRLGEVNVQCRSPAVDSNIMLKAPRTEKVRPEPGLTLWGMLVASRSWAPVSSKIAPWTMVVTWVISALYPWLLGKAVDAAFPAPDRPVLALWAGVMVALAVLMFPLLALRFHTSSQTRWSTTHWLRAGLSQKVVDGGAAHTSDLPAGEVLTAASSDTESMSELSLSSVQLAGWVTGLLVSLGLTLWTSPTLATVLALGVAGSTVLTVPVSRMYRRRLSRQRAALGELTAHTTDGISGLRVLRGVGGHSEFLADYHKKSEATCARSIRAGTALAGVMSITALTPGVLTLVLVLWASLDVLAGRLQPGDVVMVAGAARYLFMPVMQLGMFPSLLAKAGVAAGRLRTLFDVPLFQDPPGARTDKIPDGVLSDPVTGVMAQPGQLTVLVAKNPADAAQVAYRLARLMPSGPSGAVDGVPLSQWSMKAVRGAVTLNDTHPLLLSGTLRRQLDPWKRQTDDELFAALHTAAADDVVELLPEGLDDYVTERGRSLSGGQRQRVALARALVIDPQVLVLVEPTSAVDAYTESLVASRLADSRRGKTTVVVSQSPLLRKAADAVVSVPATPSGVVV